MRGTGQLKFRLVYPLSYFSFLPQNRLLNFVVDLIFEFGGIFFLVLIGISLKKSKRDFLPFLLTSFFILLVAHLVTTPGFDDFGMRIMFLSQFGFVLFAARIVGEITASLRTNGKKAFLAMFLFLMLISNAISIIGSGYEIYHRRKERKVLTWEESQLNEWLIFHTQENQRFVLFENSKTGSWSEMIPSIAGRMVYSLYPYGAAVYSTAEDNYLKEKYVAAIRAVLDGEKDFQPKEFLSMIGDWLNFTQPDFVIFRKQVWYERDQNPFLEIFKELFPGTFIETGNFVIFDFNKIRTKRKLFYNFQIENISSFSLKILENPLEVYLKEGLYLLKICSKNYFGGLVEQQIEVKEIYKLLTKDIERGQSVCFSRLFLAPEDKRYLFQSNLKSKFSEVNTSGNIKSEIFFNQILFKEAVLNN